MEYAVVGRVHDEKISVYSHFCADELLCHDYFLKHRRKQFIDILVRAL